MNITMIAGTFYLIFLFCGIGFRPASFMTLLLVVFYVGLAGAGIPVQRAGYGAVLVLMAALAGRPVHLLNSLCGAFFAILVWNPQSLWNVGFQLSFLCVFSLILILPLFARMNIGTLSLGSSLAVLFGTFPVVIYYFNIFSPVSILANLVAIPLFDAALFTGLLAVLFSSIPFLNFVSIKVSSWIIAGALAWVRYLSAWSWGYWFLERPSLGRIAGYYACLAAILWLRKTSFRGKRFVMTGLFSLWLGLAISFWAGASRGNFEITLLASGRNQLAHARFANGSHWLMNAGRIFPSDQGEWLIAPYLRSRGVQRLEGILLTDLSGKHTGGLPSVLRDFPVRYLLYPSVTTATSGEFYKLLRTLGRKAKNFLKDDAVLMPSEKIRIAAKSKNAAALLIASGPWKILFVPRWDGEIFEELLRSKKVEEIHAVYLPLPQQQIPDLFYEWLDRAGPHLVILPDFRPDLAMQLASRHIAFLDLKSTGALRFIQKGPRLEISSFLKGFLGFYAYLL